VSRRRRVGTVLRGIVALITLLVLVAGIPLLLYRLGGSPVPRRVLGWHQLEHILLRRDSGSIFLGAVRDVSWIAWAAFTLAVLTEIQAALRGRSAPRLRLGGMQSMAGRLVALTMLTFTGPATALLALPQAVPVAAAATFQPGAPLASSGAALGFSGQAMASQDTALNQPGSAVARPGPAVAETAGEPAGQHPAGHSAQHAADQAAALPAAESPGRPPADEAAAGHAPEVMNMGFYQMVTVRPGDCLWTIAQRYLGHGDLYRQIAELNLGHDMGGGQIFRDPSVIWPGWMLQLPANGAASPSSPAAPSSPHAAMTHRHGAHPSREPRFRRPHAGASGAASTGPSGAASTRPSGAASTGPSGVAIGGASRPASASPQPSATPSVSAQPAGLGPAATTSAPQGTAGLSAAAGQPAAVGVAVGQQNRIPPLAVFAAGMLAGGAIVTLAGLRHRQRQVRRPGRRIPLPVSAPVMEAEQRLRAQTTLEPASALRAALSDLGTGLIASGQQIPDITGIRVLPSGMEVLLASPAGEPPPPPFTVLGGRQGMAWQLSLPGEEPTAPFPPTETGDLLPGLFTVGAVDGGYLLLDLEYLRVTAVDGPQPLADQFLGSAAAELATSELAGWYDLILVGYPELEAVGGRATSCDTLEEALDLLASKAVALRRRLIDTVSTDIRRERLADPGDEDWALTLLVSRIPPTSGQLALLLDLASDPAGIAALVPGATSVPDGHLAPARIQLAADPAEPGAMVAHILPLQLQAWPQPLDDADYQALASLFATAGQDGDVAADAPPYDGSVWQSQMLAAVSGMPDDFDAEPESEPPESEPPESEPPEVSQPAAAWLLDAGPDDQGTDRAGQDGAGPDDAWPDDAGIDVQDRPVEPASLRVGILGTLTVNGAPGALQPAQSQLVLALALHGQDGLSNQQLCYLLGADPDHPKPSDSLRQLIVRTRRQLGRASDGREWIEHLGAGQYALHPDTRVDWHEFDALTKEGMRARDAGSLREALRLIRGQPFTGCYHWSVDLALIEAVRAQIVDAAEMLAGLELAAGDCAASARAARTGLVGDNAAEQLWRALMRAEHAAGNMSGVRETWSRCLDVIADIAVDGEPHPETAALYRQLLDTSRARPAWSPS
jgi:DNA-binding SARP family transcriptional activator